MYLTYYNKSEEHPNISVDMLYTNTTIRDIKHSTTIQVDKKELSTEKQYKIHLMETTTESLLKKYEEDLKNNIKYNVFSIPKQSGGYRQISEPIGVLKDAQRDIKDLFTEVYKIIPHDAAYAYVKNRCCRDSMEQHQKNNSNWFLKIDMKDFFPSWNIEIIKSILKNIYPIPYFKKEAQQNLEKLLTYCMLDNGLPQGSPASPTLTNILMIPFDYALRNVFYKKAKNKELPFIVYTRYADDLTLSSEYKFNPDDVIKEINDIITRLNIPIKINTKKTRFGSASGRNWNLGLMYNKDHEITTGYRKKRQLKTEIYKFVNSPLTSSNKYDILGMCDTLQGNLAYLKHINPNYYEGLLLYYKRKYNWDILRIIKEKRKMAIKTK